MKKANRHTTSSSVLVDVLEARGAAEDFSSCRIVLLVAD